MQIIDNIKFEILKIFFLFLQPFFPKKGFLCVDNLYESHASCIDTYIIFKYLRKKKYNASYLIWKKNLAYDKIVTKGVITINIPGTPDASAYYFLKKTFFILLKTKYVIQSFYGSLPTKYRNFIKKNRYINLTGVGHGPVLLKTLVFKYPFCQEHEWDKYLVTNDVEKKLFITNGWPESKLILCGLPRYDACNNTPHKQKKIFMFFTWRLTFEKNKGSIFLSQYLANLLKFLNNHDLSDYLKFHNVEIVLGVHHALVDLAGFKPDFLPVKIADSTNLIDEINSSDLFITDYSSIFFDSAFLNHPCIFYRLDHEDRYLIETDIIDRENAKQQDPLLYNIFYKEDQVIDKIKFYVSNNFQLENKYKIKMNKYFQNKDNCTKKFIECLEMSCK